MKSLSNIIDQAKKDKDILAVSIFGSFARKEEYNDIDICIFLRKKKTNLEMSKKKINYMKNAGEKIDINIFQQLPLYVRHRILKEGKFIFCANDDELYDLAYLTAKEWEDFKPIYKSYLEGVKHG